MSIQVILSPAKTLDWSSDHPIQKFTEPVFISQANELINTLRTYSVEDLKNLMSISTKLADLNFERNQEWDVDHSKNTRPAIYAFNGGVYEGLDAYTMDEKSIAFAQKHLKILSGLYGILKPLDRIHPYRLEMGTRLPVNGKSNLYEFWDLSIAEVLNQELTEENFLINLASNEYFKAIPNKSLRAKILQPNFYDYKNGKYKIISFYAKKARGAMARYIIDNQIVDIEQLKLFDTDGYSYSEPMTKGNKWAFIRG